MADWATIGIIGGVGPQAGLDLFRKILDQTIASGDQEHLDVILLSEPSRIPNRTTYLLGQSDADPAPPIIELLAKLEGAGAAVAGIPCNTSHAPRIMDEIRSGMAKAGLKIKLLDMVAELVDYTIALNLPPPLKPGILATNGTIRTEVYQNAFKRAGITAIVACESTQEAVNDAIYNTEYGIKARYPVSEKARGTLLKASAELKEQGATAVVLACTELPLAVPEPAVCGLPTIDSTLVLARALIREAAPEKLKPISIS
jgi:aspartate racemase